MLKLDYQLCFALYACSKEITRQYKPFLSPHGLTYTQYITLLVLWEQDGVGVSELGEKLMLDSGTLTPLLKRMEKTNLVERRRCPQDERIVKIFLTQKGQDLQNEFHSLPEKMLCCTGLTAQDAQRMKEELCSLTEALRKNGENHGEES